jgi:hypothetical protein
MLASTPFVIAGPFGRGNPDGEVVSAAHGSAGLPRRDFVPPRNDKVSGDDGAGRGNRTLDSSLGSSRFTTKLYPHWNVMIIISESVFRQGYLAFWIAT